MTDSVVAELLAYDECPPDEEYSPLEHGERLGTEAKPADAKRLVAECVRSLPGTLAASFLEGFLETATVESLDAVLLDSIRSACEVGSVGSIVMLLQEKCMMDRKHIAEYAIDGLQSTSESAEQDRYAYALYSVHDGANLSMRLLRELIASGTLTEYAVSCLTDCLSG